VQGLICQDDCEWMRCSRQLRLDARPEVATAKARLIVVAVPLRIRARGTFPADIRSLSAIFIRNASSGGHVDLSHPARDVIEHNAKSEHHDRQSNDELEGDYT
jgi:hypothetical protein